MGNSIDTIKKRLEKELNDEFQTFLKKCQLKMEAIHLQKTLAETSKFAEIALNKNRRYFLRKAKFSFKRDHS